MGPPVTTMAGVRTSVRRWAAAQARGHRGVRQVPQREDRRAPLRLPLVAKRGSGWWRSWRPGGAMAGGRDMMDAGSILQPSFI